MVTVINGRRGPTECCGALIYTITHKGSFCSRCDSKVYLWNGLLVTPERDEDMRLAIERAVQPDTQHFMFPDSYAACHQPEAHGFQPGMTGAQCDEPTHH